MDTIEIGNDYYVAAIDGKSAATKENGLSVIAKALSFPEHFGNNLDALYDSLTDLSWIEKNKVVLVINNQDHFLSNEAEREVFLETLKDAEANSDKYLKLFFN